VKILVGLGNPGTPYQWTRHNIGFRVVDRLAEEHRISIGHKRFKAEWGKGRIRLEEVVLLKPLTFMNLSGSAVRKVVDFYKMGIEDLVVIHDDLDLAFGSLRIKRWGGDGGHQGIRSIMDSMGGNNFLRLKVGIGRPPPGMDPADYVLSSFGGTERHPLEEIVSRAAECVSVMILEGIETAMNRFQRKLTPPYQSP
jgi:peptidyl-tRNA hydrolase, PTH1 family